MNKSLGAFVVAIPFALSCASVANAQPQAQADRIPVKLLVVISTFEGDKKVSSLPYTLLATANGSEVSFSSSSRVPIQNSATGSVSYTNIGTYLKCNVTTEAGSFKVTINFSDNTALSNKTPAASANAPARNSEYATYHDVNYTSAVSIKDGETKQLISAPDKVTGEILKIDVTLTLDPSKRASVELDDRDVRAALAIPISLN
jgi:hypothetical protein